MRVSFPGLITLLFAISLSAQQQAYESGDLQRVRLVDSTQSAEMKDIVASRKGSSGIVVSKQYFSFKGPRAVLRTKTRLPEFQFETDPTFDEAVYLFKLDVHSDRRQIRVAKGSGGLAEMSIPGDHLIETVLEELGTGKNSTMRYRLKPKAPLQPGEYCLSRKISTCHDFGVD
ncbi:MAG TPA: hypothetical protein VGN86_07970 [Pyrinomonadaceae bacterium]|nr:hypothetical protein [Pyrinomonadaceae bacterium]